jgi:Chitobiase/beta-hexosaminidase C-terminal domain
MHPARFALSLTPEHGGWWTTLNPPPQRETAVNSNKSGGRHRDRRTLTKLSALSVAALAAGAVAAPAANATIGPAGVAAGHNITVFHNIDFVAAFGNEGDLTVDVIRNGVNIGTAAGPTVDGGEGEALEVNHGPEGAAQPGDCFEGHTPDVLPGDLIRVTNTPEPPPVTDPPTPPLPATVDEVIVDDITFSGPAYEAPDGSVRVDGVAKRADGLNTPIPVAEIDSAEFRDDSNGQFRGAPNRVIANPAEAGGFTMVYDRPYNLVEGRNTGNLNEAQRKASLLFSGGHATGFGHTEVLPLESMLVDGLDEAPGPAPGCEAAPGQANSVLNTDDDAINVASEDLALSGTKMSDADGVEVTLTDGTTTTAPLEADVSGNNWTLDVPRATLDTLVDGKITVAGSYDHDGTALYGKTLSLQKDTVAPAVTADPAPGTYVGAQSVSLSAGPGESIKYSLDAGPATRDYTGPIDLGVGTSTIKTLATDAAGNTTEDSLAYVIEAPAQAVAATPVAQAVQVIAPALAPAAPRVSLNVARSSYRLAGSTRLRSARRRGVPVFYTAPAGADRMRFTVYRSAGASARRALVKRTVRVRPGVRSVALKWRGMRAGRYVVQVRALKGGRAGKVSKRNFRITR